MKKLHKPQGAQKMDQSNEKNHWENIYSTSSANQLSWFQAVPETSLKIIQKLSNNKAQILDVGAGASMLVDSLLKLGYSKLGVLDISQSAIDLVKNRIGEDAKKIDFYNSDLRQFAPLHSFDIWHDRAVFHFFNDEYSKKLYVDALKKTVRKNGHIIIATFAQDGPTKCSGLDITQYDNESIRLVLGDEFKLLDHQLETHLTPKGNRQRFIYFTFERI